MIINLAVLGTSVGHVLAASSSSDDDGSNLGLLFLASGFVFYVLVYLSYRNVDKRHRHESETEAALHDVRAEDRFVKSMTGLSDRKMAGANNDDVRGARRKLF